MQVKAKVGTGPGKRIWIGWRRSLPKPKIGDFIKFKPYPPERCVKWETGIIDEIRDIGCEFLYLIERM